MGFTVTTFIVVSKNLSAIPYSVPLSDFFKKFTYIYIYLLFGAIYTKEKRVLRWSNNHSVQFIICIYIFIYRIPVFFFRFFKFLSYVHSFHEHCTCVNLIVKFFFFFLIFNTASKPLSITRYIF